MVLSSVPMEIGGEFYHLRFEDKDVAELEQKFRPVAMLFQPAAFGYDVARIFLWKGLKKQEQDDTFVHAFTQDAAGYDAALQAVKTFTSAFPGPIVGLSLIYGSVNKALVVSGWYKDPEKPVEPKESDEKPQEIDPSKNSQRPTKRPTKKQPSGSASSPPNSSGD